jgi:CRISPR-associated endonuclease/helicase Cas3
MKSILFNSFDKILMATKPISEILPNHTQYKAHRPHGDVGEKETLEEHINLVNNYAFSLMTVHNLEPIIDKMIAELVEELTNKTKVGNWVKELFLYSIIYHDYGKINPNFQSDKMKENNFLPYDKSIKIDSQHSKLSAYIFVNQQIQELLKEEGLSEVEKQFMVLMCCVFSIPILRHHASYIDSSIRFSDEELKSIERFLIVFNIESSWDEIFTDEGFKAVLADIVEWKLIKNPLLLVALMKLNFSILTSSDYYATSDFMNNNPVNDFGVISNEYANKLYNSYWNFDYNGKTLNDWDILKSTTFQKLQERNNKNLNTLRAKLLVETVEAIKLNPDKFLYYLEAPTGGGKTNLSLALALELLQNKTELNKIFYVFPFTTLIVQTFDAIKRTLNLTNSDIIQLHSKSGFHNLDAEDNDKDAKYGDEKLNYLDNLFLNYPITLLTHIKFFNILKGNDKETNYIFHRLANSVVIIDELQTYNPKHWDKMAWMLSEFGRIFNMKFILMSATLPKINQADKTIKIPFENLVSDKNLYFTNPNFGQRVEFDFSLLGWQKNKVSEDCNQYLEDLSEFIHEKSNEYSINKDGKIRSIVEFIKKKSANEFYQIAKKTFLDYKIYVLSGEILDTRRRQIIQAIKSNIDNKVLLITTQVVEAGVDIDMDLGFKDKSLIDSDEQLAGRVNRNASKKDCKVYMFDYDDEIQIYRNDERRKITKEKISLDLYKEILRTKNFDKLYEFVFNNFDKRNTNQYNSANVQQYKNAFENIDFRAIKDEFKMIEDETQSVFVPLLIPFEDFDNETIEVAKSFNIPIEKVINGKEVFEKYISIITSKEAEFTRKSIETKKVYGLLSKFMFSVYKNAANDLLRYSDKGSVENYTDRFGIIYLSNWRDYNGNEIYSYESGVNQLLLKNDNFL